MLFFLCTHTHTHTHTKSINTLCEKISSFSSSFSLSLSLFIELIVCETVILRFAEFYVLLTVHLGIILVNNQLDARFFFVYVYFSSLHVSSTHVLIIRRINSINTTCDICHSVLVTVWYADLDGTPSKPAH
jgi:hypothetical protein